MGKLLLDDVLSFCLNKVTQKQNDLFLKPFGNLFPCSHVDSPWMAARNVALGAVHFCLGIGDRSGDRHSGWIVRSESCTKAESKSKTWMKVPGSFLICVPKWKSTDISMALPPGPAGKYVIFSWTTASFFQLMKLTGDSSYVCNELNMLQQTPQWAKVALPLPATLISARRSLGSLDFPPSTQAP